MENLYNVLGVNENASSEEIKKKYRKLSLQHHPDRGGDAEMFKKISTAYDVLGDVEKKRKYDNERKNPFASMFGGSGGNSHNDINETFKMFFGNQGGLFGGAGGHPFGINLNNMGGGGMGNGTTRIFVNGKPVNMRDIQKPEPIKKHIVLSMYESYTGKNYPLKISRWTLYNNEKKYEDETIYVPIPKGIDNNEIINIRNKGHVASNHNIGDIKVFIKIKNDTSFQRNGLDLIYTKKLSLKESLTGFIFELKHINNKTITINNDNGTVIKPGFNKIIPKLGFIRNNQMGNLIIKFEIDFPDSLSKEKRDELKKIL